MNEWFSIRQTPIDGLQIIDCRTHADDRGEFSRLFCARELAQLGNKMTIEQANTSLTMEAGTVRGLHYQNAPHAETKLIRCLQGTVWDVAVDLRPGSPSYGCWHGETLSASNGRAMLIPEGFAHGFQTQEPDCRLIYFHSARFAAAAEGGVHPADPTLAIKWPLPISNLSERDSALPHLDSLKNN